MFKDTPEGQTGCNMEEELRAQVKELKKELSQSQVLITAMSETGMELQEELETAKKALRRVCKIDFIISEVTKENV